MTSESLCQALFTQTWQVSLVAVSVWGVTRWWLHHRPWMAHLLWACVLIKAVVPPIVIGPIGLFAWTATCSKSVETIEHSQSNSNVILNVHVSDGHETFVPARGRAQAPIAPVLDKCSLVIVVWLGVAGGLILLNVYRCTYILYRLPTAMVPSTKYLALLDEVCRHLSLRSTVRLHIVDATLGPLVCGVWRPLIVVPLKVVERLSDAQILALLTHEAKHVQRGDLWWAWLQTLATSLCWFHPLVWLASRRLTIESERCCDEATVATLRCPPAEYARSLIQVLEFKHQLHSVAAWPGVRAMDITRERLERIMRLGQGCRQRVSRKQWCVFALCLLLVIPSGSAGVSQEPERPAEPQQLPLLPGSISPSSENTVAKLPVTEMPERLPDENQIVVETRLISLTKERFERLKLDWQPAAAPTTELPLQGSHMEPRTSTNHRPIMQVPATPCPAFTALLPDRQRVEAVLQEIAADRDCSTLLAPKVTAFEGQTGWISQAVIRPFLTGVKPTGQQVIELAVDGAEWGMQSRIVDEGVVELTMQLHHQWIDEVGELQMGRHRIQVPQPQHRRWATQSRLRKDQTLCLTGGTSVAKEKGMVRLIMVSAHQIDPELLKALPPANPKAKYSLRGPLLMQGWPHHHPTVDEVANTVASDLDSGIKNNDQMLLKPISHEVSSARFVPLIGNAKTHRYTYQFTYGPKDTPIANRQSVTVDQTLFELVK